MLARRTTLLLGALQESRPGGEVGSNQVLLQGAGRIDASSLTERAEIRRFKRRNFVSSF